jgi:hypothetical protein
MGHAQGFVNLGFENATFIVDPSGAFYPYSVYASDAIPGWTAYISGVPQTDILSNDVTLSAAAISLQGTNAFSPAIAAYSGNWSLLLQATFQDPYATNSAAIGQTGQIPATAQSLIFMLGEYPSDFQVTFNGQDLLLVTISNALHYNICGADISQYAGQTGQLLFTVYNDNYAELDNIQFSSIPVPEPSEFALAALGALLLGFHRRKNSLRQNQD